MKCCKVITTCFIGRDVRENTSRCGHPKLWVTHSQNFPTKGSVIGLVALNFTLDREVDPGIPTDLIIVNNGAKEINYGPGNDFLDTLNGGEIHSGRVRVIHRDVNIGRSFGGYNAAFEKFREEYDYFIFTEDDIVLHAHNYAKVLVEDFESDVKVGFVAAQGISRGPREHAHGGCGLSSTKVLSEVYNKLGKLPFHADPKTQTFKNMCHRGEVPFTFEIQEAGYRLIQTNSHAPLYSYAYDYMRGIETKFLKQDKDYNLVLRSGR